MQRQRNAFPAHRSRSAKFLSGFGTENRQGTACPAEKSNISAEKKSRDGLFHLLHLAGRKRRTGCSDFKDWTSGTAAHCISWHGNAATATEPICRNAMRLPRYPIRRLFCCKAAEKSQRIIAKKEGFAMKNPCCRFGSRGFYLVNLKSHCIEN